MEPATPLVRRERLVLTGALALVTLLAWSYTLRMSSRMADMPAGMSMPMPHFTAGQLAASAAGWAIMMTGMMIPTAGPMILTFAALERRGTGAVRPGSVTAFVTGYLALWVAFSVGAAALQLGLARVALVSSAGIAATPWLSGALLLAAGAFQLTPLKNACLSRCRTPLGFLVTGWRPGRLGALTMGLRHGASCLGCCWALMLLFFVLGTMNLLWMLVLTALVLIEKIAPRPVLVSRASAAVLIGWAGVVLAGTLS